LESDPMQTNRATKRNNRGDVADATKHDCEASSRRFSCQSFERDAALRFPDSTALSLSFRNEGAVAFIEINRRTNA
jgi:hypothetical protein